MRREPDLWFGRYLDAYQKRGDKWLIPRRVCLHEGDLSVDAASPMPTNAAGFMQASLDPWTAGRPIGPA